MAEPSILQLTEGTSPADTPATGEWYVYFKADGLYIKDDAGAETLISQAANLDVTSVATGSLNFDAATELTIATGAVTLTQAVHTIDTEADAASDDLDTISGGTVGDILYIRAVNDARSVVVKNGTGNILTYGSADITLDEDHKVLALYYDGTNWLEIGNAASGGGTSLTVEEADGTPSVSGVSTIVVSNGTLTDNGSGQVTINTGGGSSPTEACILEKQSNQSVTNSVAVALNFGAGSEVLDTDTMHDTTTNNSRITINTAGVYSFTFGVRFDANATGARILSLRKNGTTAIAEFRINATGSGLFTDIAGARQDDASVSDYYEVTVAQFTSGALNVIASETTFFTAHRLS